MVPVSRHPFIPVTFTVPIIPFMINCSALSGWYDLPPQVFVTSFLQAFI